jgi:1,4-dihydroxy-6-naphthoate synthase
VSTAIEIGISPCPNDVFAWAGLLLGEVRLEGVAPGFVLADVEELNERLSAGRIAVAKASSAMALQLASTHGLLRAGAAMGRGVGPVLLARPPIARVVLALQAEPSGLRVLTPGRRTTAHLLFRAFHPGVGRIDCVPYSEIMPRLQGGEADLGVCIHEGRFTYAEQGLALVEDLGATYEARAGGPLPLGGILVRRDLPAPFPVGLVLALRASLRWARRHPDRVWPLLRSHAQELSDAAIAQHVRLYVNAWTEDLGDVGVSALRRLAAIAGAARIPPLLG